MITIATIKDSKIVNIYYYETMGDAQFAYDNDYLGDIDLYAEMPDGYEIGDNYIDGEWSKATQETEPMELTVSIETMLAKLTAAALGVPMDYTPQQTEYIAKAAGLAPIADNKEWNTGIWYAQGTIALHNDTHCEVVQGHISRTDWAPNNDPHLFEEIQKDYTEWDQPQGEYDAYVAGDKVLFNATMYVNTLDGNMMTPTDDDAGWDAI